MYFVIFSILLVAVVTLLVLSKFVFKINRGGQELLLKLAKILCITYMALEFISLFIADGMSYRYSNEELAALNYGHLAGVRWVNELAFVTMPFILFFKNKKIMIKIAAFVVLPVSLVYAYSYGPALIQSWANNVYANGIGENYYFDPSVQAFLTNVTFRSILFGLMNLLEISVLVYIVVNNLDSLKFEGLKEIGIFALQTLFLIITMMPTWALQHIAHTRSELYMQPYTLNHLLWPIEIVIEIIFITIFCKKYDYDKKYILCFTLTLALFLQYHQMFNMLDGGINAKRIPLQLCNVASYLLIITLLTKNEKLYHFTLVGNVFGAICAIALLNNDAGDGILQPMNWHYIMEHQNIIVTPILMLNLRLFKPLEKKDYFDVLKVWIIYWVTVLVAGTAVTALAESLEEAGNPNSGFWYCNYFFMFDANQAGGMLPFAVPLFKDIFTIGHIHFKIVQPIMFVAFAGFFALTFFICYWTSSKKHKRELGLIK